MEKQTRTYTGEKSDVSYEAGRCIHAGECIRRLRAVFDTNRRPWVLPDAASPDSVAATVAACPSGALHYERKDGGEAETVRQENTIRLNRNGPLYIRGEFTIVNSAGELVASDTRAALCRCGGSANKPYCDNTHRSIGFIAPDTVAEVEPTIEASHGGNLGIEAATNGPLHIMGRFNVLNQEGEAVHRGTDEWFCRCGGSVNKPFCDGTHLKIGFIADDAMKAVR